MRKKPVAVARGSKNRSSRRAKIGARDRLLLATMGYAQKKGLGDLTLRQLAAALGTSHRMLCYHFGSKEGLLLEVTRATEVENQRDVGRLIADSHLSAVEAMRAVWARVKEPRRAAFLRLFIEVFAQALHRRPRTTDFLNNIVESWMEPLSHLSMRAGVPAKLAPADARLFLAVARGLILDLLATGDVDAVDAAYERFLSKYEDGLPKQEVTPASRKRRADHVG